MQRRANSSTAVVPRNLAARAAAYALVGFAILAPQLLGGANEKACLAILLIGSVVCLGVSLSLRQTVRSLGVVPHAAAATLLAAVWTLAQVVPIPCSLAVWLHGELGQRVRTLAQLEGASPTWCTISVAPGSTRVALAVAVLVCALLLAATALARAGQRSALMYGIALSSVAMAAVAVAHTVFAADSVFGVYQPEAARPGLLLAPLLNGNHLAGHLALGLPLCISFAMEAKGVDARVSWWTLSFLVLTTGLFTLSRAGSAVLLAGATASFAAQLSRKEGAARNVENRVAWFAGAACIAAAAYFTLDVLTPEFRGQTAPFRKIAMQLPVLKIALEHPLTGIGRGALGDVTPGFVLTDTRVLYAENILVQWLSEWGAPITVGVLTLLALSIVGLRLRRNRERALALGLAAIAAQNLVDFSLELVGVASVAAIAAGTLLSKERGRLGLARPSLRPVSVALSLAACLASIAAIPFLTTDGRQSVRIHLEGALDNPSGEFERTLKRAFKAYSVDPTLIALGAARAVRRGSANAPRWLNLAMEAAPGWAAPHQYAAYLLERRGALSQAALELSLSFEKDLALTTGPACGFVRRHPVAALSEQLVPESAKRLDVSQLVAQCLVGAGAPAEAELFLTWLMSQHPRSLLAHELAIELALNAGHLEEAVQRAKIMSALFPGNPASVGAALRALSRAGKVAEALQFYDHAPPKAQTDRRVLMEVMEAAAAAGDQGRLEAFSEETFARYGGTTAARAELHAYASHTFELAGNLGKALGLAQRSYEESSSPAMLENVHSLAQRAGIRQVALRAATELCHLRQRGETYCAGEPR